MNKLILLFLLLSSPVLAGNSIISLSGNNNTFNATQIGNQTLNFTASNLNNSSVSFDQKGGGSHNANVELYGNFNNYNVSVTQNSPFNLNFSIQQYCGISSCNPYPLIVNQTQ